jgi:hypothetical protein
MVYVLTLTAAEEAGNRVKFVKERRLTKTFPRRFAESWKQSAPWLALILSPESDQDETRYLKWLGAISHTDTPGQLDYSVTIDPLVQCPEDIPVDGPEGLLAQLPVELKNEFADSLREKDVGNCSQAFWDAVSGAIRTKYRSMTELFDWLLALGTPPGFVQDDAADRSWQEQRDCAYCISRITGLPPLTFAAWRRPASRDAPYLSGLVPRPYEQGMIEHDARTVGASSGMFGNWRPEDGARYDIHAITTSDGRRLEIMNVNASPVESRTGTDMIYYYEPTQSFTLVQYKRLPSRKKPMHADKRFHDQLARLSEVERMSKTASRPCEWRLGGDSCFMKLAYWPENENGRSARELANGMYLPISYIRMLLEDDSTRGPYDGRILGYENIERHLVGTQFIELVTHGLIGTVGVSVDELRKFVRQRVAEGQSVMLGLERSPETIRERERRLRKRDAGDRSYQHEVIESRSADEPAKPDTTTPGSDAPDFWQPPLY